MTADEEPTTPHIWLQGLRSMVHGMDVELGVTLLVGGAWITGMLTSERKYSDALAASVRERATDASGGEYARILADLLEHFAGMLIPEDPDAHAMRQRFAPALHLCGAETLIGGEWVKLGPVSVRAEVVDAFVLGEYAVRNR